MQTPANTGSCGGDEATYPSPSLPSRVSGKGRGRRAFQQARQSFNGRALGSDGSGCLGSEVPQRSGPRGYTYNVLQYVMGQSGWCVCANFMCETRGQQPLTWQHFTAAHTQLPRCTAVSGRQPWFRLACMLAPIMYAAQSVLMRIWEGASWRATSNAASREQGFEG